MSTEKGIYVFCAITEKEKKSFGQAEFNGRKSGVYTIHLDTIAMVVCKVEGEVLPGRQNLLTHQNVISEVMKQYSLIPMSFGNVFHSEKDVLLITKHLKKDFTELFSHLENKIEVGLKVIPKKEWIDDEMKKDPVLLEWKNTSQDLEAPSAFYDRIQMGERAQLFILQLQEQVEKEIYLPLLGLTAAGKQNDTIPGKVFLNAAFLIDRNSEAEFDERVNEIYEVWKDKVDFKYTGPWPAYNFVNIRLRIEGSS
ncbi:GvpL/GvpF family gas vesicle protein [Fictibacillus enclensis]|uniref:GvpL/GvpF family gas vesicle protein n=1 Tax=Fictibacillus enclensis TaxID=1017270 RepID=UPI0024BF74A2|nr:GvpL/GvpF family gas vesicle protein [Fictibacillus enclensis]MDM5336541.1 GvpL/GvpF family gas vesicle protein [Fictibacillus enclensis]WHY72993.1 GvpL/GvpF family gas vesicle protein [Fictibacillus enclensis]